MYYVYKITNILNNKFYIGVHKSKDIDNDPYFGSGNAIRDAIKKHGKKNFIREILFEFLTEDAAFAKEAELVDPNDRNTYNISPGGKGGWDYVNSLGLENPMHDQTIVEKVINTTRNSGYYDSEECKARARINGSKSRGRKRTLEECEELSKRQLEYFKNHDHPQKGKPLKEAHRAAISSGWSEESRKAKSEWMKKRIEANPNIVKTRLGKKDSDETKQKISEAAKVWAARRNSIMGECPHCGKTGVLHNLKGWHFDKCKHKK